MGLKLIHVSERGPWPHLPGCLFIGCKPMCILWIIILVTRSSVETIWRPLSDVSFCRNNMATTPWCNDAYYRSVAPWFTWVDLVQYDKYSRIADPIWRLNISRPEQNDRISVDDIRNVLEWENIRVQITIRQHWFISTNADPVHCCIFVTSPRLVLSHCGLVMPCSKINLDQHWLKQWLVAWRHQAITWTNFDEVLWHSPQSNITGNAHLTLIWVWKCLNVIISFCLLQLHFPGHWPMS